MVYSAVKQMLMQHCNNRLQQARKHLQIKKELGDWASKLMPLAVVCPATGEPFGKHQIFIYMKYTCTTIQPEYFPIVFTKYGKSVCNVP